MDVYTYMGPMAPTGAVWLGVTVPLNCAHKEQGPIQYRGFLDAPF